MCVGIRGQVVKVSFVLPPHQCWGLISDLQPYKLRGPFTRLSYLTDPERRSKASHLQLPSPFSAHISPYLQTRIGGGRSCEDIALQEIVRQQLRSPPWSRGRCLSWLGLFYRRHNPEPPGMRESQVELPQSDRLMAVSVRNCLVP